MRSVLHRETRCAPGKVREHELSPFRAASRALQLSTLLARWRSELQKLKLVAAGAAAQPLRS